MFSDLYAIMRSLDHDAEEGVHSYKCRRCMLQRQLGTFRVQLRAMVMDIDESVGDEVEKPGRG